MHDDGDDAPIIEFVNVTAMSASSSRRVATLQAVGVGAVGDDAGAERFDAVELAQPSGLFAVPQTTANTEAVVIRRGDEAVALVVIDKSRPAQSAEVGETRLHGVGANNSTAVIRIRADGSIEITATSARNISLTTSGGGDVVLNGGSLKVARATDPVSVTLTALQIGTIIAPAGGGPCTGGPITITGTVNSGAGAAHVKA